LYSSYTLQWDCDLEVFDALQMWQLYVPGNTPLMRTVKQLGLWELLMHLLATVSDSVTGWEQET